MPLTIDEYRCKLITKILFAQSPDEVTRFIDVAMKSLKDHKVNGYIITRFVTKTIHHLGEFSPIDHNAQQWTNIKLARKKFDYISHQINVTAE